MKARRIARNPLAALPATGTDPAPGRRGARIAEALGPAPHRPTGRRPAADLADAMPVRTSVTVTVELLHQLRAEVLRRQAAGERCDVSSLLRAGARLLLAR